MNRFRNSVQLWKPIACIFLTVLIGAGVFLIISSQRADKDPAEDPVDGPQPPVTVPTRAELTLAEMTDWEKVCQLFVVHPTQLSGTSRQKTADYSLIQALSEYPVGGLIYDGDNIADPDQLRALLEDVAGCCAIAPIQTLDEEGGRVSRLKDLRSVAINAMYSYRNDGTLTAFSNAETIGNDIKFFGFNVDLAPVADVWSNPQNTVIGNRAYSDDYQQAAELIKAAVEGFHSAGVGCTLKHFPGHGDTREDSHSSAAYVTKTLEELRREELLPFAAGIEAGADMVMMGHLTVTDISSQPALFSYQIVTELLREELGFNGVIITDGLEMKAVTSLYSSSEIVLKAFEAGVDMFLSPNNFRTAVQALYDALENGTISQERLDQSVLRILELKERYGLLD